MSAQPAEPRRWDLVLGGGFVLLLPVFFVDGFHDPFTSSKLILTFALGAPAALGVMWRLRGQPDPLAPWRLLLLLLPLFAVIRVAKTPDGVPLLANPGSLIALAVCWIGLELGAAFGASANGPRRCVTLLAFAAVPVLAVGLLRRYAGWFSFIPDRPDANIASTIGNSLELAEFAAPTAILAILLPLTGRPWGWLLVATAAGAVAASGSRGGAVALVLGALVTGAMLLRSPNEGHRDTGRPTMIAAILAITLALCLAPDRVRSIFDTERPTNAVRLGLWRGAVDLWMESPLVGCGAGRFEAAFPPHRDPNEWDISGFNVVAEEPHQELLWILSEFGLLGALATGAALWLGWRSWRSAATGDDRGRALAAVTAGGLVAFAFTACVRAPLHHPCGILPPALALGLLAAAGAHTTQNGRSWPRLLSAGVLILGATAASLFLHAERDIYVARWAKAQANVDLEAGELRHMVRSLTRCKEALDSLAETPPRTAAQAWRAALVGSDLAELRARMSVDQMRQTLQGLGAAPPETWLPSQAQADGLVDLTLLLSPHHAPATIWQARAALLRGDVRRTHELLSDPRTFRSAQWPQLQIARGEAALVLGTDAGTAGAWLNPPPAVRSGDRTALQRAAQLLESDGVVDAHVAALSDALMQLGQDRFDLEALGMIARCAYRDSNALMRDLGDRAVARSRVLFAQEALESGNTELADTHLRIARRKDPALLDALILQARRGDQGAITKLQTSGIPEDRLRALLN